MTSRWQQAQLIERAFWDGYRGGHSHDQRWLLGVLGIAHGFRAASVIDLGGGPHSVLLQIPQEDVGKAIVIDPLPLTFNEEARYKAASIYYYRAKGEDVFDVRHHPELAGVRAEEVWLYNVLQHVETPALVLEHACRLAHQRVRLVEWLHEPIEDHHPHTFGSDDLELSAFGFVTEQDVVGRIHTNPADRSAGFAKEFRAAVWRRVR